MVVIENHNTCSLNRLQCVIFTAKGVVFKIQHFLSLHILSFLCHISSWTWGCSFATLAATPHPQVLLENRRGQGLEPTVGVFCQSLLSSKKRLATLKQPTWPSHSIDCCMVMTHPPEWRQHLEIP